jgi:hypothetical protein
MASLTWDLAAVEVQSTPADQAERMKDSVVCLVSSAHRYNVAEPWKHTNVADRWGCGTAVGPYRVITTAQTIANHTFVKALRYGQPEFVSAKPIVIDYESDLCLIELNPDELQEPLKPLSFAETYAKGEEVRFHWFALDGTLNRGQGYLDRAHVEQVRTSYGQRLRYVIANASQKMGLGELYCLGSIPIGIGCWAGDSREADLIPGETLARFLHATQAEEPYRGFGEVGFITAELRDPAMRSFLKMPKTLRNGVYVSHVYHLGTGAASLQKGDVLLDIDGHSIDSHGRYSDPTYGPLSLLNLITQKTAGQEALFTIWRDGQRVEIAISIGNFEPSEMLVPYQEYDRQPEYIIMGGFVFQKLTRDYLLAFGKNMSGEAPSHLYHYYRDLAFNPTDERKSVWVLSHALPIPSNLGYTGLRELVVDTFNGMPIASASDILAAAERNPDSPYHVVQFEMGAPTLVIPRDRLEEIDAFVSKNYGINKLSNIHQ